MTKFEHPAGFKYPFTHFKDCIHSLRQKSNKTVHTCAYSILVFQRSSKQPQSYTNF